MSPDTHPTPTASQQPTLRFLCADPLHAIALGFGSGLSPWAPGTFGTLFGWATFRALDMLLPADAFLLLILLSFVLGIVAIEKTGKALGEIDHGGIVWDEIVPFWGVLWLLNNSIGDSLVWQGIAFVLFRLYDITKPWPARYYDRQVKNGYGVMMDDVIAALYTVGSLAILIAFAYLQSHSA